MREGKKEGNTAQLRTEFEVGIDQNTKKGYAEFYNERSKRTNKSTRTNFFSHEMSSNSGIEKKRVRKSQLDIH